MISLSSCRCFPLNSERSRNIPVMLPPGRAMLATNPASTGSISRSIPAIGIVRVAFLAAAKAQVPRAIPRVQMRAWRKARAGRERADGTAADRGEGAHRREVLLVSRVAQAAPQAELGAERQRRGPVDRRGLVVLRLARIPFEIAADGSSLKLLRVEIDALTDVGSLTPHLGGATFRYDPLPSNFISHGIR